MECVQYKNLKFEVGHQPGTSAAWHCIMHHLSRMSYNAVHRQVWDLGGQANLRPSWATYYRATDAVIVVIDSTDRARASIAKVAPYLAKQTALQRTMSLPSTICILSQDFQCR